LKRAICFEKHLIHYSVHKSIEYNYQKMNSLRDSLCQNIAE